MTKEIENSSGEEKEKKTRKKRQVPLGLIVTRAPTEVVARINELSHMTALGFGKSVNFYTSIFREFASIKLWTQPEVQGNWEWLKPQASEQNLIDNIPGSGIKTGWVQLNVRMPIDLIASVKEQVERLQAQGHNVNLSMYAYSVVYWGCFLRYKNSET
ncbi:MAG: hypothetical protein Q7K26_06075 [bacterium]|nr:hypothetical protein [bacterium]